jgi:hypothetical protein
MIAGAVAYSVIFVIALILAMLMSERKGTAAATVAVLFAVPPGIAGVLDAFNSGPAWLAERREDSACRAAAALERIEAVREADGFALLANPDTYLPGGLGALQDPARVLAMGYAYVQHRNERFVQASGGESISVTTDEKSAFSVSVERSEQVFVLSVFDAASGAEVASKRWLARKSGALCPEAPATEFLARALKPAPRPAAEAAQRYEIPLRTSVLATFPERLPSAKLKAARERPAVCGAAVEVVNPFERGPRVLPILHGQGLLRVTEAGTTRTLYSRSLVARTSLVHCAGNALYLVADGPDNPRQLTIVRLERPLRMTRVYALRLDTGGDALRGPVAAQVLEFAADKGSIRFTRVLLHAPVNLNEPSVRVAGAHTATLALPVAEGFRRQP